QSILDDLNGQGFTRLELWTRGVDRTLFYPRPEVVTELPRPVFICVGRVAAEKNLPAFLKLDLPGTKLIVGDGPSLNDLRARFPEAAFVGKREGASLANTYAAADVF